jgi:NADH-quinone oxidoreductase subunit L
MEIAVLQSIGLLPALPLAGFLILFLAGGALPRRVIASVGAGSIGLAFLVAVNLALPIIADDGLVIRQSLYSWLSVGDFSAQFGFTLDGLSCLMVLVITGVGFLIHLYSTGFMADDPSYSRFFAIMNLFVASMLVLVLADNLLLLYLGWEGVGLCSYLLIGFWYSNPENGYAARKAFVTTRVGDTSMALGLFLLFTQLGTLDIQELMTAASAQWPLGSGFAVAASLLLLGGAVGKSAQLPLQTWLPDAMAGPTPISALIHAATMVTAGVYLIARTHVLFELAPSVQLLVAFIGLATLLIAGFTAMTQHDIKRILAYSTISQIGYMFLGLGVGAWSASVFHLMTHAFFKALLFLAAGTVILSLHHEHDIFKMGGKRRQLPLAFACFMVGSLALTAFPYTSGYFSKDEILLAALEFEHYGMALWLGGVIGAFFTGLYSFRLVFVVFFGPSVAHSDEQEQRGASMSVPLLVLIALALLGGFLHPPTGSVFSAAHAEHAVSGLIHGVMIAAPLAGTALAYAIYGGGRRPVGGLTQNPVARALHSFWFSGWGFDWLYRRILIEPFLWLARVNRRDIVDSFVGLMVTLSEASNTLLLRSQNGGLRWYVVSMVASAVLLIALGGLL